VAITSGEFALLAAFVQHPQRPLSRERLIDLARGPDSDTDSRSMDVQVSRLRRLIEPDPSRPRYVQTVWGYGYVFVPDGRPRAH
jgi:two-component system phosphate regulon response regulator OmpR